MRKSVFHPLFFLGEEGNHPIHQAIWVDKKGLREEGGGLSVNLKLWVLREAGKKVMNVRRWGRKVDIQSADQRKKVKDETIFV